VDFETGIGPIGPRIRFRRTNPLSGNPPSSGLAPVLPCPHRFDVAGVELDEQLGADVTAEVRSPRAW
jgi:hypothetical protein